MSIPHKLSVREDNDSFQVCAILSTTEMTASDLVIALATISGTGISTKVFNSHQFL